MGSSGILPSFLGALQASLSVLLTISYGVIAAQYGLLNAAAAKKMSAACVNMFLPALLFSQIGSEISADTLGRYVPILCWAILYNVVSIGAGILLRKTFKLPGWAVPALAFNNTTSMPLLLVQALGKTGILKTLLMGGDDSISDAVGRAKVYFLVNTTISNSITFALGPGLLSAEAEDAPEEKEQEHDSDEEDSADEQTSLLPSTVIHHGRKSRSRMHRIHKSLPPWLQKTIAIVAPFANAPVYGAALGVLVGLIPGLQKLFFADQEDGGIFTAWLTTSIENIGDLFASLQVLIVGVKLAEAMRATKEEHDSDESDANGNQDGDGEDDDEEGVPSVPWKAASLIWAIRFVIWPAVSIVLIWLVASRDLFGARDPVLYFTMMLMPAGPPALKLSALAEVNGSSQREKLGIAKFLSVSYALSPLMAIAVVGSLKASENAFGR